MWQLYRNNGSEMALVDSWLHFMTSSWMKRIQYVEKSSKFFRKFLNDITEKKIQSIFQLFCFLWNCFKKKIEQFYQKMWMILPHFWTISKSVCVSIDICSPLPFFSFFRLHLVKFYWCILHFHYYYYYYKILHSVFLSSYGQTHTHLIHLFMFHT